MTRRTKVALMAATAMLMPADAYAQTWDAHESFSLDANDDPSSVFRYMVGGHLATQKNASCMDEQGQCVLDAEIAFAGVYRPRVTGEWLTIGIDSSMLFIHPAYVDPTAILFVAPKEGAYRLSGGFKIIDHYPTGVIVSWGAGQKLLDQPSQTTSFSYEKHLEAGQTVAFSVDPNGDYGFDSTGVSVQATYLGSDAPVWQMSDWGAWSTTCGAATRIRTATCVNPRTGSDVGETRCAAIPKPATSESSMQTPGCTYSWKSGEWGSAAPSCGVSVMSRTIACMRSDGTSAADDLCDAAPRPAMEAATTDYSTCSFSWATGAWSAPSTTCGQATENRETYCQRSDGSKVDDAQCPSARPEGSRSSYQISGCTFSWKAAETWGAPVPACGSTVQNRSVTCQRSDGVAVEDASCPAADRPATQQPASDLSTCGYSWETGAWSSPTHTCGSATRTRDVTCRRSDGATVDASSCTSERPDAVETVTDYSTCTTTWRYSDWSAPAPACGATSSTRTAECVRQDGTIVEGSLCGVPELLSRSATDYGACSYAWRAGEWATTAACGTTTRTRSVTCVRMDGTTVADDRCEAASRPMASEPVSDTSGCGHDWIQTAIGTWSTCRNGVQSRSISVQCRRSDGIAVPDGLCTGTRPASQETRGCGAGPDVPASDGTGLVIFRRQIESRP